MYVRFSPSPHLVKSLRFRLDGTVFHVVLPGEYIMGGKLGQKRLGEIDKLPEELTTGAGETRYQQVQPLIFVIGGGGGGETASALRNSDLINPNAFRLKHDRPGVVSLALSVGPACLAFFSSQNEAMSLYSRTPWFFLCFCKTHAHTHTHSLSLSLCVCDLCSSERSFSARGAAQDRVSHHNRPRTRACSRWRKHRDRKVVNGYAMYVSGTPCSLARKSKGRVYHMGII